MKKGVGSSEGHTACLHRSSVREPLRNAPTETAQAAVLFHGCDHRVAVEHLLQELVVERLDRVKTHDAR